MSTDQAIHVGELMAEVERLLAKVAMLEGTLAPLRESVSIDDVRKALGRYEDGSISLSRLTEVLRAAASTIATQARDQERERCAQIAEITVSNDHSCCIENCTVASAIRGSK